MKIKDKITLSIEQKIAVGIIGFLHVVGLFLLNFTNGNLYFFALDLVPINLIFTVLLLLKYQKNWNSGLLFFGILAVLTGFIIEVIGTKTGLIFGQYSYGEVLGAKLFDTPLLIGLNWFLLTYCAGCTIEKLKISKWTKALIISCSLVIFDYFMEPVAIKHGFWSWQNGNIPTQNYIGWFFTSLFLGLIFQFSNWDKSNKVAPLVLGIQFLFFLLQNIL